MAKVFEFDATEQKESLINLYGQRRQETCTEIVYNIEFLEMQLAKLKEKALAGRTLEPSEVLESFVGTTKYVQDKTNEIAKNVAEIEKCNAVLGALWQI